MNDVERNLTSRQEYENIPNFRLYINFYQDIVIYNNLFNKIKYIRDSNAISKANDMKK